MPELFQHQREIADFIDEHKRALVFADPGTGKTAAVLEAAQRYYNETGKRILVICPKSIMVPAWVRDCHTFTPELSIATAEAPEQNRRRAFKSGAAIVVINHDGTKWLRENAALLKDFGFLVLDESTAFKNKDSQRTAAITRLREQFDTRVAMTGTPMSNGLLDVWSQAFLVDDGEHLGARYYAFRAATHDPIQVTPEVRNWVPKEGATNVVADMLSPISLRYSLEECVDIPENSLSYRFVDLSNSLRKQYEAMERQAVLEVEDDEVEAINAATQMNKLLQIASGAVYGEDQAYKLNRERYDLVAQLVAERTHPSIIGFSWKHQRDGVVQALERHGIDSYAVLDGEHSKDVDDVVKRFQTGEYRCLLAHPQTAGHGLTLTRAKTVIWASPTWNAELFDQLNRRIYRTGQNEKTETILIAARNTVDERVLDKLTGKIDTQASALDMVKMLSQAQAA